MSTTVRANGTVQFTFFSVMRLNITIVKNCDSLNCNPCNSIFSLLKLENGLKKHVGNVATIKYGFVELVVILSLLMQDVILWFLLVFAKRAILNVWQGSEYASVFSPHKIKYWNKISYYWALFPLVLFPHYVSNKTKGWISKWVLQKNKADQIFRNISYPLICTHLDELRVQERQQMKDKLPYISISVVYLTYPSTLLCQSERWRVLIIKDRWKISENLLNGTILISGGWKNGEFLLG